MITPVWKYRQGILGDKYAQRLYRDDELCVQCEVHTRRRADGTWLEGKVFFYIDNDPREFRDEADLMLAWEELKETKAHDDDRR